MNSATLEEPPLSPALRELRRRIRVKGSVGIVVILQIHVIPLSRCRSTTESNLQSKVQVTAMVCLDPNVVAQWLNARIEALDRRPACEEEVVTTYVVFARSVFRIPWFKSYRF